MLKKISEGGAQAWGDSVFAWPERLTDTDSWHSHIPFGFWCVDVLRPRVIVELGVHQGDSYCAFCQAVERLGTATECFGVDTWVGDHEAGFYGESVFAELRTYHDTRYGRFSRLVRATFDEALGNFPDGSVDLLHIDGLHTYAAVRHDFESWLPKLSPAAVVLFHDINVREKDFGAWRFWSQIAEGHPHFAFHHGHGLGLLVVGRDAPAQARWLTSLTGGEADHVRRFFARLGEGVLNASHLRRAEVRAASVERMEREAAEHLGTIERLHAEAEAHRIEIQRLHADSGASAAEVEALRSEAGARHAEVEALRSEAEARHAEIERLQEEVADLGNRLAASPRQRPTAGLEGLKKLLALRLPRRLAAEYQRRLVAASGLFRPAWYLKRNPDIAAGRIDPLRHFLLYGAREGRDPHPSFSTSWYLASNPDVAAAGINPLVHYILCGATEGRRTRPATGCDQAHESAAQPATGTHHAHAIPRKTRYRVSEKSHTRAGASADSGRPPVVCVTHVSPWPRRAGNEYRTGRLLDWLSAQGFPVVVVLAPLAGDSVIEDSFPAVAARYKNAVMCLPNGHVTASLGSVGVSLRALDGRLAPSAERSPDGGSTSEIDRVESTFCHHTLIGVLLELERRLAPLVWYANYIFMTRFLELAASGSPSFVDTHDVFSSKREKVARFGISEGLSISAEDEARLLRRADAVVAIQDLEGRTLQHMVPERPVITAGVDFDFDPTPPAPADSPTILCVGSDNMLNVRGLQDFLRFAWPIVAKEVPDARVVVAGRVGPLIECEDSRVEIRGVVDELAPLYRQARVVINPAVAGTGLKIKTVEALSHFCPTVTWPNGVDGLPPQLRPLCTVVEDWFDFARKTAAFLLSRAPRVASEAERADLQRAFAADTVYRALGEWLEQAAARARRAGGAP